MCYRHREHPLCVRGCERHNSTTKPAGIQPSLKTAAYSSPKPEDRTRKQAPCVYFRVLLTSPDPAHWTAPRPPAQRWVMEPGRYLSLAKLFKSLYSKIVFIFLLTFGCKTVILNLIFYKATVIYCLFLKLNLSVF